jgi:carbonic anhydrase/acetyltransferase-like protein (isoleucine patch superfamily)
MEVKSYSILAYDGMKPKIHSSVFLAGGVRIIGNVEIEEDAGIWFNAVLRGDVNSIHVGKRTNIQDAAVIHVTREKYPVRIGENNTVGHSAVLHGCIIGDYNLIGMGSCILDGAKIGNYCLIAAGTLVPEKFEVPDGVLVAGIPGKIKRSLTNEEKKFFEESARSYILEAKKYSNI